ncbi:universal stress protein [Sphaerisporangium sp. NPDC051017]|uniref:universal stress protein n=1 Tax=Sphaerisporangium sp. NPDC051017 TaxID=3154636 RepID=UPI003433C912
MSAETNRERIVVGMDHRSESRVALGWAAAEAHRRGADLVVVHASDTLSPAPYAPVSRRAEAERRRLSERAALDRAIAVVEDEYPDLSVRRYTSLESPVKDLLRHTEAADLLVLGSSAPGGAEAHLGPLLLACLRHARCPVVVVNGGTTAPPRRTLSAARG